MKEVYFTLEKVHIQGLKWKKAVSVEVCHIVPLQVLFIYLLQIIE